MTNIRILQTLDREQTHYTSAILVARSEAESELYRSCLSVVQRIRATVNAEPDEINHTVTAVIDRLQRKVYPRPSVRPDAVACDNIRLAIRQLRRLIQPAPADNEPIDIFDI